MKDLTIQLTDQQRNQLNRLSDVTGIPVGKIVRTLIDEKIKADRP